MKKGVAAVALVMMLSPALAADSYRFDPDHTRPMFEVKHIGLSSQHGRFGKVDGRVELDTAAQRGTINFIVETASIDMGTDGWNQHMKSDEFFNVLDFPAMTFRSDKLLFDGDRVIGAEGQFTLLGVTRPLRIDVAGFRCGPHPMTKAQTCGADIDARIKRSDFGMTRFIPLVGDEVKIFVPVEAIKE
jgi:polyisoprenoid-binding protein YceI